MKTVESDWITIDRNGRSTFRYENKCQRGYFNCNTDCMNCNLGKQDQIEKSGKIIENYTAVTPNFRNMKFFTKSNINNLSFFEHRSSR